MFGVVRGYALENQSKSELSSEAGLAGLTADVEVRVVAESWPDARSYALILPASRESVVITPRTKDSKATVAINGGRVPRGKSSDAVPLQFGMNKLDVVVTAEDGKTQECYELKVFRAYAMPNWVNVVDQGPFSPRDSAGELVFDGRMWLFGGYTPDLVGDVWCSADGSRWTQTGQLPDGDTVNIPACFVHQGKMWIASSQGRFYSSDDGKNWTRVLDKLQWSGVNCGAVLDGKMWVIGGAEGREVWSSSDGVSWQQVTASAPWSRRWHAGNLVAHAGRLWVMGGSLGKYQPFKAYSDVWSSSDGVNWTLVTDHAPWPARKWTSCLVYRNRIWLLGGFRGQPTWQNFNDVWYSSDGKGWRQLVTEDIWSPRHEISAYVHDDSIWVVAGNAWPLVNDVWKLHIAGLTFTSQPVLEEYVGARYEYRASADFNESAKPIMFRLAKGPEWLSVDAASGVVSGVPGTPGDYAVSVEAYDEAGESARQDYNLHVVPL